MNTNNPSEANSLGEKTITPTIEQYNYFKNSKPQKRKMKGSRLIRLEEIEDCLNTFPQENPLIHDSLMGEFKVPIWAIRDEQGREKLVDSAPHTKVFRAGINKRILYKLPNAAHALLNWIILNQDSNGFVFLNEEKIRNEMAGLKHYSTFNTTAVETLIDAGIIAEYHKPYYHLNPRFFHFGSRVKSYPRFIKMRANLLINEESEEEIF